MQFNEIHIDGFGIFIGQHITGLSSGVNVMYGPNEFGKTTLLAFIRQMLFGFPSPASARAYPALSGGEYGGRLVCKLADGEIVTISRKAGRSGGPVECRTDSKTLQGQPALDTIIGQISAKLYENVYAISLEELQQTASLEDAEVRNHIYGPGLELGTKSLTEIQNTFIKQSEEIFKPSGSAQLIRKIYREIREKEGEIRETRKLLSRYDEIGIERDELQGSIDQLESDINKLEQEQNTLEAQINMFPTYVLLTKAQEDLADTEETSDFSEDAVARLDKLEANVLNLENQAAAEAREMDELVNSPDNVLVNTQIIDLETSIVNLYKQSELFKRASEDIGGINADMTRGISDTNAQIGRLGANWTVEKVIGFQFDLVQEDHCRTAKTRITDSQRNIERVKAKLAAHKESKATDASHRTSVSPTFRVTGYISAALGAVGIAAGIFMTQPVVSVASSILFVVGLILSLSGRGPGLSSTPDASEINYIDELALLESDDKRISEEWREQLRSAGINEDLSPDGALDIVRTIKRIQSDQKSTAGLEDRSGQMQEAIDSVNKLLGKIDTTLGKKQTNDGTIDRIEELTQELEVAKSAKNKKEGIDREIKKQERKILLNQESLETTKDELAEYISSAGVTDGDQFKHKFEIFEKRKELKEEIVNNRTTIQKVVGSGEYYDNFIKSVSTTDPATLTADVETRIRTISELKADRDEKIKNIGELRVKLEDLSTRDLGKEQTNLEVMKQNLHDYSVDWVRSKIASFVLDKAISKYENTRQPEVIKAATDVFKQITNDAYQMIIKPTGMDEVVIQDFSQKRKSIREMSRGTKEQLYFAMRLGLISTFETTSEPMPIIMDDILANFDDDRGQATIEGLLEFSEKRQVLVLTCHKNTFEVYKRLGANHIYFD